MSVQTQAAKPEANGPRRWLKTIPWPQGETHKYARGGLMVAGGGVAATGAARLCAIAGLRVGAGAVTVACDREALPIYATHLTSVMTRICDDADAFAEMIASDKVSGLALGPGLGQGDKVRRKILAALATGKPTLLDADALTEFEDEPQVLFKAIRGPVVLTPHEGEFARLFGKTEVDSKASREARAIQAARVSGAVIVLKGHRSLIAAPDGRLAVNENGVPELATAGSGDVLSGLGAGLLAQKMEAFDAACAAVWIHGEAGAGFGPGLIAEDLPGLVPGILKRLKIL